MSDDFLLPNNLAQDRHNANTGNPAVTVATVIERYQGPKLDWLLKVQLTGGKIIKGVKPLTFNEGRQSTNRLRLPPIGARGIITWPDHHQNNRNAIWLGTYDDFIDGIKTQNADDNLMIHPSGHAQVLDHKGNSTQRFANGDLEYEGTDGGRYEFRVRDEAVTLQHLPVTGSPYIRLLDYIKTKRWMLAVAEKFIIAIDAVKRTITLAVAGTGIEIRDGKTTINSSVVMVESTKGAAVSAAKWPESYSNFKNLAEEMAALKKDHKDLIEKHNNLSNSFVQLTQSFALLTPPVAPPVPIPVFTPMISVPAALQVVKAPTFVKLPFVSRNDLNEGEEVKIISGKSSNLYIE